MIHDSGGTNTFRLGGIKGASSDGNDTYRTGTGADHFALYPHARDGSKAGWGHDKIMNLDLHQGDRFG